MKIAISASGANLETRVDPRFGRCPYYIFVDTETGVVEAQQNVAAQAGGGAGIQAAQYVVQQGAQAVITGNVGPNAHQVFAAAGLPIYTVAGMTVAQAVAAFKNNTLAASNSATGPAHAGMGRGTGRGRGAGLGMSSVPTPPPAPIPTPPPAPSDELEVLQQEIAELRRSVALLVQKLDELEKK